MSPLSEDDRRFIDRAARAALQGLLASDVGEPSAGKQRHWANSGTEAASLAFDLAEALWLERAKRCTIEWEKKLAKAALGETP